MANYSENYNSNIIQSTDEKQMRTQTKLIKDKGERPSGKKLIDPRLPRLFQYHYGNPFGAQEWVVIPKGRIVSIVPDEERKAFDDNKYYNMVTIANGGEDVQEDNDDPTSSASNYTRVANKPVGVSTLNIYQDIDGKFSGNLPNYVTKATINLPLFSEKDKAEEIEWGSAYGDLKPGDSVKSDENGRFVKWQDPVALIKDGMEPGEAYGEGDSIEQKVGRVHRVNKNLVPAGWLKWAMPEYLYGKDNNTGFSIEDIQDGMPYDPAYKDGFKGDPYRPTGIPGLTDGMNYTKEYEDIRIGTLNENMEAGDKVHLRLPEEYTPFDVESYTLKANDTEVGNELLDVYHVSSEEGLFSVELQTDINQEFEITVDFAATHQMPGMPTNIDWDGVVGSVDIVIQL